MRTPLTVRGTEVIPAALFTAEGNVLVADVAAVGLPAGRWPEVLIVTHEDDTRLGFQFDSAEAAPSGDLRWVRYATNRRDCFVTLIGAPR